MKKIPSDPDCGEDTMTAKKINNPKILLVNPPFYRFITFSYAYNPLGNRYIAAMLRKHEYETYVYNFDFPEKISPKEPDWLPYNENYGQEYKRDMENPDHPIWKEIEATLQKIKPDILGVSTMTPQMETAIHTARLAKRINPDCVVVFGGIHPTALPFDTLKYPEVDIICVGEGEITMLELVRTLEKGGDLREVEGIAFTNKDGIYQETNRRALIKDLDSIPYPIRDFPTEAEREFMLHRGSILTSRGCPYQCTFCARKPIWGKTIRYRSAE
ncbi:MAG: cobalamin-dependent protein, partial [Spirochaetota bacterium]|nr:cobalamin-dependent protein [Spirochaetota bacterium]